MSKNAHGAMSAALSAAVPSPSGAFLLVNTSLYRSEDLYELVAGVEASIPATHRVLGRVRPTTWVRHSTPLPQPVLLFRGGTSRRRRMGTDTDWVGAYDVQRPTVVTLRHPDTLYASDLEALIAACDEDEFVPAHAVRGLVDRLVSLYDAPAGCVPQLGELAVRVERERLAVAA